MGARSRSVVGSTSAFSGSGAAAGVGVVIHDIFVLLVSRRPIETGQRLVDNQRQNRAYKIFLSFSMLVFVKYGSLMGKCVVSYIVKYGLSRYDYNLNELRV